MMNDPSALALAAEAADLHCAHHGHEGKHDSRTTSLAPAEARPRTDGELELAPDGRTPRPLLQPVGGRGVTCLPLDPNVDAQRPLVASTGAGSAGRPACAPAPPLLNGGPGADQTSRAGGLPNPAETREDRQGENAPARPLCSRCEQHPAAHGDLCEGCDEILACMANEIERGGEDWWAGS